MALVAVILCLCFGVFSSNESADGTPMTDAIVAIDDEFTASLQAAIENAKASNTADVVEILFTGDMEDENSSVSNWVEMYWASTPSMRQPATTLPKSLR